MELNVPSFLVKLAQNEPEVAQWLEKLPHHVAELAKRWELVVLHAHSSRKLPLGWDRPPT